MRVFQRFNGLSQKASVIIVTYNHEKYIRTCLLSVLNNNPKEVIVIDNNSKDKSAAIAKEFESSKVKVIKNKKNVGYGLANNLGVKKTKGKYVVILNPDTRVESNCLEELLKPLVGKERTIVTPKILTYDGLRINTCGNIEHFTGLTFCRGLNLPPTSFQYFEQVSGFSGACFAMKKGDYMRLGDFNKQFFSYMEDTELSWRAHVKGVKIFYIPTSVVYHDYNLKVSPQKIYHLEKGRYMILKKYLNLKWLLALFPSLLMTEILTWGYAFLQGREGLKFKLNALRESLQEPVKKIRCSRKKLLKSLAWKVPESQLAYSFFDRAVRRMINFIYWLNYHFFVF
jgi:hypothetical protein